VFPAAATNNAAYCTFGLSWTIRSVMNPASARQIANITNPYRCFSRSDNHATSIEKKNPHTQGATEYSWVFTGL
jgi:hypothetical protein